MAELEAILVRLHDQLAADVALAIPNVFVVDGIGADVFPSLTIGVREVTYEDDERDWDLAQADLVLQISHEAGPAVPSEELSRTYARKLRQFLIQHRLLGNGTAGSALLQGSRVSRQTFATVEGEDLPFLYLVETTWQIDWRAPRKFAADPIVETREITVTSETPHTGGIEILEVL